jgi:serine protease
MRMNLPGHFGGGPGALAVSLALALVSPAGIAWADDAAPAVSFGGEEGAPGELNGEIAVDMKDDALAADVADLSARYGVSLRPNSAWSWGHDKIEVADVDPSQEMALLAALSRDPRVEHAEPMTLYRAMFVPDDPLYEKQWHLARVGAEGAWSYSCGKGVTVAVIDTGVACFDKGPFSRGTDLGGTRCEGGWNFVDDSAEAADDNGHGTHVAGTIAQTTSNGLGAAGLAFCATLMPIKVLTRQGFGTVANVAEGIRWAADEGAQVVNLSLGGPMRSRILEDAVNHALEKGVVVVAAAGNSGRKVGYPAAYPGVIAVSATDDSDTIAPFSSRGPEIAIAAPGVRVTQQTVCNGGRDRCEIFGTFNGTSMAAPHVAGAAAMVEELGTTDGSAVRDVLTGSARAKDDGALYGAGIVDARAAVRRVYWRHLAGRALSLLGLGWLVLDRIRRRGGRATCTFGAVLGALATSVGLAPFAPLVGLLGKAGKVRTVAEFAMRPFGEWDMVAMGAGAHHWLLLASALPAFALALVAFNSARLRPFIGGVALGTSALLVQMVCSADTAFVAGATLARVWQALNVLVCVWLARVALDSGRSGRAQR